MSPVIVCIVMCSIRTSWCVWCIKYWLFGDKQVEYYFHSFIQRQYIQPNWIWFMEWLIFFSSCSPSSGILVSYGRSESANERNCSNVYFISLALVSQTQLKYLLPRWNIGCAGVGWRRQRLRATVEIEMDGEHTQCVGARWGYWPCNRNHTCNTNLLCSVQMNVLPVRIGCHCNKMNCVQKKDTRIKCSSLPVLKSLKTVGWSFIYTH